MKMITPKDLLELEMIIKGLQEHKKEMREQIGDIVLRIRRKQKQIETLEDITQKHEEKERLAYLEEWLERTITEVESTEEAIAKYEKELEAKKNAYDEQEDESTMYKTVERWFHENLNVPELDQNVSEAMKHPAVDTYGNHVVHVRTLAESPEELLQKIGVPVPKTLLGEVDEEELEDRFNLVAQWLEDFIHTKSELEDGRYLINDTSEGVQLLYREEIYG